MSRHNNEKNYSFYTDARTRDIIKEWNVISERRGVSGLIREAIRRLYRYPYNVHVMLETGLDKLDKDEMEYFKLLHEAMTEALRGEMRRIMSAPEPVGLPPVEDEKK